MIDVFTLTRDRLDFTKDCFTALQDNPGHPFRHWILDNGSQDGTVEWLKEYRAKYPNVQEPILCPENLGIAKGMNLLKERILANHPSSIIIKIDNDCMVKSQNILGFVVRAYSLKPRWAGETVLSPTVTGINRQPEVKALGGWSGIYINYAGIVGGLFRVTPLTVFREFTANESLPKAYGVDGQFADWFNSNGGRFGYFRDVTVEHYLSTDGQAIRYPDYFTRKKKEEKA